MAGGNDLAGSADGLQQELDLEAELEALFAQIESKEPGIVMGGKKPAVPAAAPAPIVAAVEAAPAVEQPARVAETPAAATTATMSDEDAAALADVFASQGLAAAEEVAAAPAKQGLQEDELAAQLQALIEGARQPAMATPAPAPAAEPGPAFEAPAERKGMAALSEDDLANELQSLLDAAKSPAPAAVAVEEPPASEPAQEVLGNAALAQIDQALAKAADEAVAGEFETIDDVMGGQAPAAARASPTAAPALDVRGPSKGLDDESELAGDFASPDDLLGEKKDAALAAAAQAASAKPEAEPAIHMRLPTAAPEPEAAAEGDASAKHFGLLWPILGPLSVIADGLTPALFGLCRALNVPAQRLSPEMRSVVGYVALITIFNATCLIVYGLLT